MPRNFGGVLLLFKSPQVIPKYTQGWEALLYGIFPSYNMSSALGGSTHSGLPTICFALAPKVTHTRTPTVPNKPRQFVDLVLSLIFFFKFGSNPGADPGPQDPMLWRQQTNTHRPPSPVEEKGQRGYSLKRRTPWPLPWQAFIAFLGTLHWGWSSFTKHRFRLQKTKERVLLIT